MFREFSMALAMFLGQLVSHDVGPAPGPCLTGPRYEDGSAVAICLGPQHDMGLDLDGQLFLNRQGNPMRLPGWVVMP